MKSILKDNQYKNSNLSIKESVRKKLSGAEKNIALLRVISVALNMGVFIFLIDKKNTIEWLAYSVIVSALLYSLFVLIFHSFKKADLFLTSYFTTSTDALLITLWIIATGGFDSPFYILWYISILAVAMRYTMSITVGVAIIYSLLYLFILAMDIRLSDHLVDVVLRIAYLLLIAVTGGITSKETIDLIEEKILIEKSGEEIKEREQKLKEAYDKMEEYVKERTTELHEINRQLVRINEDNDNFVYSVSHDLKTPVLNAEALIHLLYEEHPPQSAFEKDLREKLSLSIARMNKTINSLTEVAKAQKGLYEDVENINFSAILHEVIAENEEVIKRENATIRYDFHGAEMISCSRTCIKSIVYNLLTNAIKYKNSKTDPVIEFKSQISDGHLIFSVKDNGLGIDVKKNKEKLFKIFKRFHDHVEGAGIGLYTIKKMVERFNGEIYVESEPGAGSTFYIKFRIPGTTNYLAVT